MRLYYICSESIADELCQGSDETQEFMFTNSPGDNILKNSHIPRSQPIGIKDTGTARHRREQKSQRYSPGVMTDLFKE